MHLHSMAIWSEDRARVSISRGLLLRSVLDLSSSVCVCVRACLHLQTMYVAKWTQETGWDKGQLLPYGPMPMLPSAQVRAQRPLCSAAAAAPVAMPAGPAVARAPACYKIPQAAQRPHS